MLLGKIPHPETGEMIQDLEAAQFFADQLEMLAHKTKGNLDKSEEDLLNRSLTLIRMAYVETVGSVHRSEGQMSPSPADRSDSSRPSAETAPQSNTEPVKESSPPPPAPEEDERRKKFTKKY